LSVPRTLPQSFPRRVQNAVSVSAVQPHTLAETAPHVCGEVHVPHDATDRVTPQLSWAVTPPQFFPSRVQNVASASPVQPHTFAAPPPPHVTPVPEQVPHEGTVRFVPQLSAAVTLPQLLPSREQNAVLFSATHPQTLGETAPQV
jgi:hypothetical protein